VQPESDVMSKNKSDGQGFRAASAFNLANAILLAEAVTGEVTSHFFYALDSRSPTPGSIKDIQLVRPDLE